MQTGFDVRRNMLKSEHQSVGLCGRYVGNAIQKSFPDYIIRDGKGSGKSLEDVGFLKISDGKNYEPQKGDVKVYQPYDAFAKDIKKYRVSRKKWHVQMFDGIEWINDFKQWHTQRSIANKDNGMYPNSDYKIYRNPKLED